jgi:hypothetical protein
LNFLRVFKKRFFTQEKRGKRERETNASKNFEICTKLIFKNKCWWCSIVFLQVSVSIVIYF